MANFNYLDFFKAPNPTDHKLFIKDKNNNIVWTISNFMISSYFVQNNNIRINFTNGDFIIIDFNNVYESKIALNSLKAAIRTLNDVVPFNIEKDIKLYIDNHPGLTGPQGSIGVTGSQGFQGDIGPQGNDGVQGPQGDIGPQGNQGSLGSSALVYEHVQFVQDGETFSMADNTNGVFLHLDALGSISNYGIVLPQNPYDGQVVYITAYSFNNFNWDISAITITPSNGELMDTTIPTSFTYPNRKCTLTYLGGPYNTWVRLN